MQHVCLSVLVLVLVSIHRSIHPQRYLESASSNDTSGPDFASYAYGFRHVLYSTQSNRGTYIFAVSQNAFREPDCRANEFRNTTLELVNQDVVNIGKPFFTIATLNGRYVFNIVERQYWELEAQERAVEVRLAS